MTNYQLKSKKIMKISDIVFEEINFPDINKEINIYFIIKYNTCINFAFKCIIYYNNIFASNHLHFWFNLSFIKPDNLG